MPTKSKSKISKILMWAVYAGSLAAISSFFGGIWAALIVLIIMGIWAYRMYLLVGDDTEQI